jgi:uncharacterized protein (TIGR03437 family)
VRINESAASLAGKSMIFKNARAKFALIVFPFMFAAALPAQTVSSVRIYTDPAGLEFWVDGQQYVQPVTLLWPQGSTHSITTILNQNGIQPKTQFAFASLNTNLGIPASINSITADPDLTWVALQFATAYAVDLNYFTCPAGTSSSTCQSPGTVIINGQNFIQNGELYLPAGSTVTAEAHPNTGWIFAGWLGVPGSGNTSQAFLNTWTANGPMTLYPVFQSARPVSVGIATSPVGLQVLVDRTPVYSPTSLEWGWNTTHQLGGISPQYDLHGNLWVFDSWSDGGAYSHAYTVPPNTPAAITLTANYVTGTLVTFLTNPPGLALSVDGRTNYPNYTFAWAPGSKHTVTALASQVDANGNAYTFSGWSNNGPATQQITVSTNPSNNRYTASYQAGGALNIKSTPTGVPVQIDGQTCPTPCSIGRAIGATVRVKAPPYTNPGDGSRLDFLRWSDSTASERVVTLAAQPTTLNASYKLRYQLQTGSDHPEGLVWHVEPATADSFFDPQTQVLISAQIKPGYQFLNWTGDASGSSQSVALLMNGPHTVGASLNPVPYIAPSGIQNSAAPTQSHAVAPGSAVAIYGVNLAADINLAPEGELAQSLDNVSVRANGQVLPLFFVSPGQINAQLPSNLPAGYQNLVVHIDGKPDASQSFMAARNAPGLFGTVTSGSVFAVATHQDGSAVSASSPARRGEVVTFYGTGLGPYNPMPVDGLAVPAGAKYTLADPVKVMMGDLQIDPVWAGAAAGRVGVAAVQIKIADSLPHGTSVSVKLHINSVESNSVLLPVE